MRDELQPLGVTVANINPGVYRTGFNDRLYDTVDQWYDEDVNFTPAGPIRDIQKNIASDEGQSDAQDMIDKMIEIIPADRHKFQTLIPQNEEEWSKEYQREQWELEVDVNATAKAR